MGGQGQFHPSQTAADDHNLGRGLPLRNICYKALPVAGEPFQRLCGNAKISKSRQVCRLGCDADIDRQQIIDHIGPSRHMHTTRCAIKSDRMA